LIGFTSILMRLNPESPSYRVLRMLLKSIKRKCNVAKAHFAEHMTFYTRQLLLCIDRPKIPTHLRLTYIDQREGYSTELYYYSYRDCAIRLLLMHTKYLYGLIAEIVVFDDAEDMRDVNSEASIVVESDLYHSEAVRRSVGICIILSELHKPHKVCPDPLSVPHLIDCLKYSSLKDVE